MKQSLRHQKIIELVKLKGYASTEELVIELEVSPQTIRRDLNILAEQDLIRRHHGGAAEQSGASGFYQLKMGISQAGFPGYQEDFTYWNSQWLGKQLFSAGQSFGGQHHFRVRNRPDRRQRGGK